MIRILVPLATCLLLLGAAASAQAQIRASGSSFAEDLYTAWGELPNNRPRGGVQYESIGSSGGIRAVTANSVDFGASEIPLSRERLTQARLYQVPTAIGGVVVVTNLGTAKPAELTLNGSVLGDIYRGTIKRWNAPEITKLNPNVTLPDLPIVPVIRAEGSGTTYAFTAYLVKSAPSWKQESGPTNAIKLAGAVAAPSNKTVADTVAARQGAIGYVEFSFASELKLPTARLMNKWGERVAATPDSFRQAVQAADWELIRADSEPTFELDITDAGCPRCWPIAAVTYALIPRGSRSLDRTLDYIRTGLTEGRDAAEKLGYVALPTRADGIIRAVMSRWSRTRTSGEAIRGLAIAPSDSLPAFASLETNLFAYRPEKWGG
jgi:phosphate transport system substrate-binding protein